MEWYKKVNPVSRLARKWSQAELAHRAGISRAAVSAIEVQRLTPSIAAALLLATVLECSVEELFGRGRTATLRVPEWAWKGRTEPCRYWEAEVNRRRLLYPVEAVSMNPVPHDGIWEGGMCRESSPALGEATLTLACCDPAAGLLATEYARTTGFRLLVFPRIGRVALDLVRQRLVHVAGLHVSTTDNPQGNVETVRAQVGERCWLLRAAQWEEGIASAVNDRARSTVAVARCACRRAALETGSAERKCLDELMEGRRLLGRQVNGHAAVAEAVRAGWAGAGICVRFSAEEAGLKFLPIRKEAVDFCFPAALRHDPRIQALIRLMRSRAHRRLVSELPGYDARQTGEMMVV